MKSAPCPAGARLVDTVQIITRATALRLRDEHHIDGAIRYVPFAGSGASLWDATRQELDELTDAGLGVMLVQRSRRYGWRPTGPIGRLDGFRAAEYAASIGYPPGSTLWADLEGVAAGLATGTISWSNYWTAAARDAGYDPGLYVGAGSGLSAAELYRRLTVARYWRGCSRYIPEVERRGFCMRQARQRKILPGLTVCIDTVQPDQLGGLPRWATIPRYPLPDHPLVIEPFAGSASYSVRLEPERVILVERDPIVAAVWRYLIRATPAEILAIPLLGIDQSVDDLGPVPPEARWLVGFWLNNSAAPCRTFSKRKRSVFHDPSMQGVFWSARIRERIASRVEWIRSWQIIEGDYTAAPDVAATWFVDPPYQRAGVHYRHGSRAIDYARLGEWCRSRTGQVIACENEGADWLPFRAAWTISGSRIDHGVHRKSTEAIWCSGCSVPGQLELVSA